MNWHFLVYLTKTARCELNWVPLFVSLNSWWRKESASSISINIIPLHKNTHREKTENVIRIFSQTQEQEQEQERTIYLGEESSERKIKMGRNGEGESVARTSSSSNNTHTHNTMLRTRRDPFLIVCKGFSVITSLTAILCIAVNVLSAIRSFKDGSDVLSLSLPHSLLFIVSVCMFMWEIDFLFFYWNL